MRKVLCLVLALALSVCAFAGCGETAEKDYVIATDKGFSPFEFQDAEGNIVGIDMDILAAIAEDQGFTYDLQYIGWDAAIAACQAGQADGMIAGASITEHPTYAVFKQASEILNSLGWDIEVKADSQA